MAAKRKRPIAWKIVTQCFASAERAGRSRVVSIQVVDDRFAAIGVESASAVNGVDLTPAEAVARLFADHSHLNLGIHSTERAARAAAAAFLRWEIPIAVAPCECSEVGSDASAEAVH